MKLDTGEIRLIIGSRYLQQIKYPEHENCSFSTCLKYRRFNDLCI